MRKESKYQEVNQRRRKNGEECVSICVSIIKIDCLELCDIIFK